VNKRPTFQSLKENEWLNGDDASQKDIETEMKERYSHMLEKEEMKQKIEKAKVQMLSMGMDAEFSCEGKGMRSIELAERI
jgi:hypothetical protein